MGTRTRTQSIDAGQHFFVYEHVSATCGQVVCVDTRLDPKAPDELTLSLRRASYHGGRTAEVEHVTAFAVFSLSTSQCTPMGDDAARLLAEKPWVCDRLAEMTDWLRERVRRANAQRDRSSWRNALARAEPGAMLPYDDLFPDDWDLLVGNDEHYYWAIDHHCPDPMCSCADLVLELQEIDGDVARRVGSLSVDLKAKRPTPKTTSPEAAAIFPALWAKHGPELRRRHAEVRGALQRHAVTVAPTVRGIVPVGRNAQCPCGSGKKYKRCCAGPAPRTRVGASPACPSR